VLTRLQIRNFKVFEHVEIELADRVVFVGPNNSGKTSALQALALWSAGARQWAERRGNGNVPRARSGVALNRRDLIALPVPSANLLWRDLHVREGFKEDGRQKTRNVLVEICVEGVDDGKSWRSCLEFDYANEESFYCRSGLGADGSRLPVPPAAARKIAYLPPMSGLASNEPRLDEGAIGVRIGEGRTAEVLRNLCWLVSEREEARWQRILARMKALFGVTLDTPRYVSERGEITMTYRTASGVKLDLSASGRGQQQTLLLLSYMAANPGAVLLLDEPDAHLEVLRQRQIYDELTRAATETASQIIAASHSEIILNEAADRDVVVAFVGSPHRIDDRGSQLLKSLKEIGFEQYLQAEQTGWVLYLEGSTDLAILQAFAERLGHPARLELGRPFVRYVVNQPNKAQEHFYGLREAKPDLRGIALFDHLGATLPADPNLACLMWRKREIKNYLCQESTLLDWAHEQGRRQVGELFAMTWRDAMRTAIVYVADALRTLHGAEPWDANVKASDDFLDPLFRRFYDSLGLPNLMRKTDFHTLAQFVPLAEIDDEVREKLDAIALMAGGHGARV
jgi:predicted ATPase